MLYNIHIIYRCFSRNDLGCPSKTSTVAVYVLLQYKTTFIHQYSIFTKISKIPAWYLDLTNYCLNFYNMPDLRKSSMEDRTNPYNKSKWHVIHYKHPTSQPSQTHYDVTRYIYYHDIFLQEQLANKNIVQWTFCLEFHIFYPSLTFCRVFLLRTGCRCTNTITSSK